MKQKGIKILLAVLVVCAIGFPTWKWQVASAESKSNATIGLVQSTFSAQYTSKNPTNVQFGTEPVSVYLATWLNTEGTTMTISACIGGIWVDLRQVPVTQATAKPTVTPTPTVAP